jgi:hypothetical protein
MLSNSDHLDPDQPANQPANIDEPTGVVMVRMPLSMRAALKDAAHDHRTSMNKFCIRAIQAAMAPCIDAPPGDADCEVVVVGDYGDTTIHMGSQKLLLEHAALLKMPTAVDARAFGRLLHQPISVRFIDRDA